jgi:hypothetical protein
LIFSLSLSVSLYFLAPPSRCVRVRRARQGTQASQASERDEGDNARAETQEYKRRGVLRSDAELGGPAYIALPVVGGSADDVSRRGFAAKIARAVWFGLVWCGGGGAARE